MIAAIVGASFVAGLVVAVPVPAHASPEPSVSAGFLKNPGFEAVAAGQPSNWTFHSVAGTSTGTRTTSESADGASSAQITNAGFASQGRWASDAVPFAGEQVALVSAMVSTDAVDGRATVSVTFLDATGSLLQESSPEDVALGSTDWTSIAFHAAAPSGAVSLRVALTLAGSGTARFDAVVVDQPVLHNQMSNGGAESAAAGGGPGNWWVAGETITPEPLTNGGFDAVTATQGWWGAKWSGTSTLTAGIQASHQGTKSAKIVSADPATKAGWVNHNGGSFYDVEPGIEYTVSYYVNIASLGAAAGGGAANVRPSVLLRDDALTKSLEVFGQTVTEATGGWALQRFTFIPPEGWTKVRFNLVLSGEGTVSFDSLNWGQSSWARDPSFANKDGGKTSVTWDATQHAEGSKSLRVAITDDAYTAGWASAVTPVRVGEFYRASAALKTTAATYGAVVEAEFVNADGGSVGRFSSAARPGTADWTRAGVDAWAPAGAIGVRVNIKLAASGEIFADAIEISQPSNNRVVNPSDEYAVGVTGGTQGRSAFRWAGDGTSAIDGSVSRTGQRSVRSAGDSADDKTGWIGTNLAVEAGRSYNISVHAKLSGVANKAELYAIFSRADGSVVSEGGLANSTGTRDWTGLRADAFVVPAEAAFVRLDYRLSGAGTAWFDDAMLEGPLTPSPGVLFTGDDVAGLIAKANTPGEGADLADTLVTRADDTSISALQSLRSIDPWTVISRGIGDGFQPVVTPAGTASVEVAVDVTGRGAAFIDDVAVTRVLPNGRSEPVDVANASFEIAGTPASGWTATQRAGAGSASGSTTVRTDNGTRSVSITNTSSDAVVRVALSASSRFAAAPAEQLLYQAEVRVDDPGMTARLVITYYDASGTTIRTDEATRAESVSWVTRTNFGMGTATTGDAVAYLATQDADFAERAKLRILYQLREMKLWVARWAQGEDPRSFSAFFSTTRTINYVAQVYDTIRGATRSGQPVVSTAEQTEIEYLLGWMASQFSNTRYYDTLDAEQKKNNITLDRHGALAMVGMVLPKNTEARAWYDSGTEGLAWMLDTVVTDDGAWPESSRYQGGIMRTLIPVLVGVKNTHPGSAADDWFDYDSSDPRFAAKESLKKLVSWFVKVQTPIDPVGYYPDPITGEAIHHDVALTPGIDDANWEPTWFAPIAWAASQYASSDTQLAGELMWTWDRGGRIWSPEATPGNALASFALLDPGVSLVQPNLTSIETDGFYQIIRDDVGTSAEDYLLFGAGDYHIHGHYGATGISLWSQGVPLVLDSGVIDYGQSLVQWYRRTSAQNRISLYTDSSLQEIKYRGPWNSTVLPSFFSNDIDYVGGDTAVPAYADPDADIAARRHVFMVKAPFEAYVMWDDMRGILPQYGGARFWLNTLTDEPIDVDGPMATVHGHEDVDLDVRFLSPGITLSSANLEQTGLGGERYTDATKQTRIDEQTAITVPIPVSGRAASALVVLQARDASDAGLEYEDVALVAGSGSVRTVRVSDENGASFLILLNETGSAQSATFAASSGLVDHRGGAQYAPSSGNVTVEVPAHSITILQPGA